MHMSVPVGRYKPNTGRSVFDRNDVEDSTKKRLNGADNYFKSLLDFSTEYNLICTTDGTYCVRMQDFSHGLFISMFNIRIGVGFRVYLQP